MKLSCLIVVLFAIAFLPLIALADGNDLGPLVPISTLVDRIRKAPTASDAIAAYADAVAKAGEDLSIRQAFVVRMVDLYHPEMAAAQARQLTSWTNDGLPWAVVAFTEAQQGHLDDALVNIKKAAQSAPENHFVMQTAGQLVAWYDMRMDPANESDAVKEAVNSVRTRLNSRKTFGQAYSDARTLLTPSNDTPDPEEINPTEVTRVLKQRAGTFVVSGGGAPATYYDSGLANFYAAPYGMFRTFGSYYQPWAPNVYYASGWWNRSITRSLPFPGPTVDPNTRYLRLPGLGNSGFALVSDDGTEIYQSNAYPYYDGYGVPYSGTTYFAPPSYGPIYSSGFVTYTPFRGFPRPGGPRPGFGGPGVGGGPVGGGMGPTQGVIRPGMYGPLAR